MANTTLTVTAQGGSITGGLVAKSTSGQALAGSVDFRGQGKFYFECTWNVFGGAALGVGLGDRSLLTVGAQNGAPNILVLFPNQLSSGIYANGTNTGINLGANCVVNDVVCTAVDLTAGLVWFRRNAGNWNGSGTANPATGVGGVNYLQYWLRDVWLGGFAPYAFMFAANDQMTLNFGDSAFAQAVPSGFGNWIIATGVRNRASTLYTEIIGGGVSRQRVSTLYAEVISSSGISSILKAVADGTIADEALAGPQYRNPTLPSLPSKIIQVKVMA